MKTLKDGKLILAKLEDGEDLFKSLEKIFRSQKMDFAVILSGVGMLRKVKLGYFIGQGKYKQNKYRSCFEIVSFSGNLCFNEKGEFKAHIHTVLGKKNKKTVGGHLITGEVHNVLELALLKVDSNNKIYRKFNPKTQLEGLEIDS